MHVYRWDLDKTYLDTDIHSVRGMIRSAFEPASHKRNVPGAAALLRALIRHDPSCRVSILSGSPTQMRDVLEEKLAIDGIRWDTLILKDNLGNFRRGRFRAIRGQLGYKLPQLFKQRQGLGRGVTETLFGDDSEVDGLIYTLYAEAVAGRLDGGEISRVMEAGGAYPDMVADALAALRHIARADAVEDVFIHVDRGMPLQEFHRLGRLVVPVFSWFQAAVVLWIRKRIDTGGLVDVARACMSEADLADASIGSLVQDLVRRGHVDSAAAIRMLDSEKGLEGLAPAIRRSLGHLGKPPPPPACPSAPDFLGFLKAAG